MLYVDIYNSEKDTTVRVGTVGEFVKAVISQLPEMQFTSKWFSTKGVLDMSQLEREEVKAFDRVIQGARDNAKIK